MLGYSSSKSRVRSAPKSGCLDILQKCGWIDCHELFHETHSETPLKELEATEKCTAHDQYRIDYCFAHGSILKLFKVVNAFVYRECTYSDHLPLCIDLQPKARQIKL